MPGFKPQLGKVVRIDPAEGEILRFEIIDEDTTHESAFELDGKRLSASCTCETFGNGRYCEHIWAALVAIQNDPSAFAPESELFVKHRPRPPKARRRLGRTRSLSSREPAWMGRLSLLRPSTTGPDINQLLTPEHRQLGYFILLERSRGEACLCVEVRAATPTLSGWSKFKPYRINSDSLRQMTNPEDRELCTMLRGAMAIGEDGPIGYVSERGNARFRVPVGAWRSMAKRFTATGRCFLASDSGSETPLQWDGDEPWVLWGVGDIEHPDPDALPLPGSTATPQPQLVIDLQLRRNNERLSVTAPSLALGGSDGLVVYQGKIAQLHDHGAERWVQQFRSDLGRDGTEPIRVPLPEVDKFLDRLYRMPNLPELDLPEQVSWETEHVNPKPRLEVFSDQLVAPDVEYDEESDSVVPVDAPAKGQVAARLTFSYGNEHIRVGAPGRFIPLFDPHAQEHAEQEQAQQAEENQADDNEADEHTHTNGQSNAADTEPESEADVAEPAPTSEPAAPAEHTGPRLLRRDVEREQQYLTALLTIGFRMPNGDGPQTLSLPARSLPRAVGELLSMGFDISADRRAIAAGGTPALSVSTGSDWFELRGAVKFETESGVQTVALPEILAAARSGRTMIQLDDGSQGLLPIEWLQEHGVLTALGQSVDDYLKFHTSQAAMLDTLLQSHDTVQVDDAFVRVRERLHQFQGVTPADPSESFLGQLRKYQRDGVGWSLFLRAFGFGGILADDMGLGKTIQMLAMLDRVYHDIDRGQAPEEAVLQPIGAAATEAITGATATATEGEAQPAINGDAITALQPPKHRPTLVVAPRSVIFNWIDEAQKFTPHLRLGAYTGTERHALREQFAEHDVLVTSYGLMRRDIEKLIEHEYEYVILDEAQAIKNPMSQSAKAARMLRARNRIALTGTPVENHMGDLWSIFEFLNPGMLGAGARFTELVKGGVSDVRNVGAAEQVGKAIRPFILRRTKKEVLTDLPEKTEQTIICEMEPDQQKIYDDLKKYYRGTLLGKGAAGGGNTMMVLEALLRLRQAACHPALIDPTREDLPSAKLDTLMEQLEELIDEGHKALVFSQFTSMLALARKRLDERGVRYAYLDGQTRDRRAEVQKFQEDESLQVFLISLKAGGLGLNLTQAEYVFILDPWWNPAVEQQAIDRTHRIGQTRHVFAYRLICKDTVEQRIAELQAGKKKLADAIIGGQEGLLSSLTKDELERLLT